MPDDDDSVELNKTELDERIKSLIEHRIGALLKQFTWAVALIVIIVPALVAVVLYAERKYHFIKEELFTFLEVEEFMNNRVEIARNEIFDQFPERIDDQVNNYIAISFADQFELSFVDKNTRREMLFLASEGNTGFLICEIIYLDYLRGSAQAGVRPKVEILLNNQTKYDAIEPDPNGLKNSVTLTRKIKFAPDMRTGATPAKGPLPGLHVITFVLNTDNSNIYKGKLTLKCIISIVGRGDGKLYKQW
jgi:hypothetical protein